jgi:hypothetical protein
MKRNLVSFALYAALLLAATSGVFRAAPALGQNAFELAPAVGGTNSYLRLPPTYVAARVLAANVAEDHTVPTGAKYVVFSASCAAFYVKRGGTAAVPAGDVTDGTASELNPAGYYIVGVTTLGLIAPATCVVTMAFYS